MSTDDPFINQKNASVNSAISSGWNDLTEDPEDLFDWVENDDDMRLALNQIKMTENDTFINPLDAEVGNLEPKFLFDELNRPMLIPGLLHIIYGPSESLKSFLAMTAALETGGIYLDLEMGIIQLSKRIRDMAYPYEFSNGFITGLSSADEIDAAYAVIKTMEPTVVVIDSLAQLAMNLGKDTNNGGDMGYVLSHYARSLTNLGFTVVVLDHLPKAANSPDHPVGSQNKKAQADVMYRVQTSETGAVEIFVEKDRTYSIRERLLEGDNMYGTLKLGGSPLRMKVLPVGYQSSNHQIKGLKEIDYKLMDRIIVFVEQNNDVNKTLIEVGVRGNKSNIAKMRDLLIEEGYLEIKEIMNEAGRKKKVISRTSKMWRFS